MPVKLALAVRETVAGHGLGLLEGGGGPLPPFQCIPAHGDRDRSQGSGAQGERLSMRIGATGEKYFYCFPSAHKCCFRPLASLLSGGGRGGNPPPQGVHGAHVKAPLPETYPNTSVRKPSWAKLQHSSSSQFEGFTMSCITASAPFS